MKKTVVILILLGSILTGVTGLHGETVVSNGGVTMFTIYDMMGIIIHDSKKIMLYKVNKRQIALISVRTWFYDAQFARTLKTRKMEGTYPTRKGGVDSKASPLKLNKFLLERGLKFDPKHKIPGLAGGGKGGGGNLITVMEVSSARLLVVLDSENQGLLVYSINSQSQRGIEFLLCRSILMEAQIPIQYPYKRDESPAEIRMKLKKIEQEYGPRDDRRRSKVPEDGIPFEVKDMKIPQLEEEEED